MSSTYTKSYARTTRPMDLPTLIDIQLESFEQFMAEGLAELFDEISPIESFNGDLKLFFPSKRPEVEGFNLSYWFGEPKYSCLLYTSDAADERSRVDLGGLRIIKKKT